jgi:hypothetical protein
LRELVLSRAPRSSITVADLILAVVLAALGVYLLVSNRATAEGARVTVWSSAGDTTSCSLAETRTIRVRGLEGETVVSVEGGRVKFISSPCPHKICVRRGAVSRCGEWIACVPNGVVATISGERAYDGITP